MLVLRGGNEAEEERMRLIGAGFEFRMELHADVEGPVGKLDRFNEAAVRREAGEREPALCEHIAVLVIELMKGYLSGRYDAHDVEAAYYSNLIKTPIHI